MSLSRDALKRMWIVSLATVISVLVSGTEDANVHSSSSAVAAVLPCWAMVAVGAAAMAPPSRSRVADGDCAGLTDCWYWNGDACRGAAAKEAKGSGVRAGWAGG